MDSAILKLSSVVIAVFLVACAGEPELEVVEKPEHSRQEILARHSLSSDGNTDLAAYGDRENVSLEKLGNSAHEIAETLGPPHQVNDRAASPEGIYVEIHDTYDARWYVTYSQDVAPVQTGALLFPVDQVIKIERQKIVMDAAKVHALRSKHSETQSAP